MANSPKIDVTQTIAICRVLVNGPVTEKITPARADKPESIRYAQEAVIVAGEAARPLAYEHVSFEKENTLKGGVYILPADALKLNGYGTPELNRYAELIYVGPMSPEQNAHFVRKKADMSDIMG